MQQLSLDLPNKEDFNPYSKEDFVPFDENCAAISFLEKFFAQERFSQAQFPSLILRGESKSGKTHLLNAFSQEDKIKDRVEFLQIEKISHQNFSSFFTSGNFYILENIEQITDEELLLHLINAAVEAKAFLILSVQNKVQFQLRDLSSRIRNIFAVAIKSPSQETIKMLLINAFARRQLRISGSVINFISNNSERTYEAVSSLVKLVEFYSTEVGKNITVKDLKKFSIEKSLPYFE